MGKGYADIFIEPFSAKYPDIKNGYLIELKYISRSEFSEALLAEKLEEAEAQLRQYAADEKIYKRIKDVVLTRIAVVYCGWEMKAAKKV